MSLTGLLKMPASATRAWILERFPLVREIAREASWDVAGSETMMPPFGGNEGLLGAAFDYRLRAWIQPFDARGTVAQLGAEQLDSLSRISGPATAHSCSRSCVQAHLVTETRIDWEVVDAFFDAATEVIRASTDIGDRSVARVCVLLALLESIFRSGYLPTEILVARNQAATVEELLSLVPDEWAQDGVVLLRLAADRLPSIKSPVLNPIFLGSTLVGGADADLISGEVLLDLKARMKPEVKAEDLFQLLGYVLLDSLDTYGIRRVGIYLARQGWNRDWSLAELAGRPLSKGELMRMRAEFSAFVLSDEVKDQRPLPRLASARRPGGSIRYLRRPTPETVTAYRRARGESDDAWLEVRGAADRYEQASRPGYLYWRRDPALRTQRQAEADAAAKYLRRAVAAAEQLDMVVAARRTELSRINRLATDQAVVIEAAR